MLIPLAFPFNPNPHSIPGWLPEKNPGAGQGLRALRQVQSWFPRQGGDEVKLVCGHLRSWRENSMPSSKLLFIFICCLGTPA